MREYEENGLFLNDRLLTTNFGTPASASGRAGTVVGISVQIGGYPMGRFAGRVDTLHEWLLVKLPQAR
jgi:hypothetical protein